MPRLIPLLLFLSLSWLAPASASARDTSPLDVSQDPRGIALGEKLSLLEDPAGKLSLSEVRKIPDRFEPGHAATVALGFSESAYWVRLPVINRSGSERTWLLELGYPHLDHVELYVPTHDGGYEVRRTGDSLPFASREIADRYFVFELHEPRASARSYYLRVQSSGQVTVPLTAWTAASFRDHQNREQPLQWMFYGLLLVMALYNAFVYFSVREREYFYYVGYVLAYALFQATLNGHTFQYLLPNQVWLANRATPFFLGATVFWATRFLCRFLLLNESLPKLWTVMWWGGNLSLLCACLSFVLPYGLVVRLLVVTGVPLNLVMSVGLVILLRRGYRPARFFAVAWSAFLVGVLLYYLRAAAILPSNVLTQWGVQFGAACEVVLLSLALADRINRMRRDLSDLNAQLGRNVHDLREALHDAHQATRAKGQFLATVSHELRTPLNAIINMPRFLLGEVTEALVARCTACDTSFALEPEEQVSASTPCPECCALGQFELNQQASYTGSASELTNGLTMIERAGKHLLDVVNGILDFSKLGAQRLELKVELVPVDDLLGEVVGSLGELARRGNVGLVLDPVPAALVVQGDTLRLKQVLINLIGNAVKFSDGRGSICVGAREEAASCLLYVRDQGIGIAPDHLEKVFQTFDQVDQSDTRKYGGTGLGLSISRSLVELHGGRVWVESELGKGSTFFVRLPRERVQTEGARVAE